MHSRERLAELLDETASVRVPPTRVERAADDHGVEVVQLVDLGGRQQCRRQAMALSRSAIAFATSLSSPSSSRT